MIKPSAACLTALIGCFLFVALIVGGTVISDGLSTAQRVMTDLVMPVGLAWLAALAGLIYHWKLGNRSAAIGFACGFLAIWILFSPVVSGLATSWTEAPPLSPSATSAQGPHFGAVVVLGGGAGRNSAGEAELTGSGERLALAAKLWHAGKTEAIICTGTAKPQPIASADESMPFDPDDPAEVGREILIALAVPAERIFRCAGENTAAEMRHLKAFLLAPPEHFPDRQPIGLITSAFHLPRAIRLAKAAGLGVEPLPAGTRGLAKNDRGIGIVVPTAGAGDAIAIVAKEWLARLLGR